MSFIFIEKRIIKQRWSLSVFIRYLVLLWARVAIQVVVTWCLATALAWTLHSSWVSRATRSLTRATFSRGCTAGLAGATRPDLRTAAGERESTSPVVKSFSSGLWLNLLSDDAVGRRQCFGSASLLRGLSMISLRRVSERSPASPRPCTVTHLSQSRTHIVVTLTKVICIAIYLWTLIICFCSIEHFNDEAFYFA